MAASTATDLIRDRSSQVDLEDFPQLIGPGFPFVSELIGM